MLTAAGGFVLIVVLMMAIPLVARRGSRSKVPAPSATSRWERRKRNYVALWRLILVAMAYGAALDILQTLTGSATAAGTVGLALGLFICAHPAANAVNILIL